MSRMLIMKALFKSLTRYKTILTWPIIIFPMSCIAQVEAPSSDSSREGYLDLGTNKIFYSETGRIDSKYTVVFE
jgi:hypothetical protein